MDVRLVFVSPELLAEMNESESLSPEELLMQLEEAMEDEPWLSIDDLLDGAFE